MLINLSGPQRVEISDTLSFLRRGLLHVAHWLHQREYKNAKNNQLVLLTLAENHPVMWKDGIHPEDQSPRTKNVFVI
jgi:hypothetical protein